MSQDSFNNKERTRNTKSKLFSVNLYFVELKKTNSSFQIIYYYCYYIFMS